MVQNFRKLVKIILVSDDDDDSSLDKHIKDMEKSGLTQEIEVGLIIDWLLGR